MEPTTPIHTVAQCFDYLRRNAWQFEALPTYSTVTIKAHMLRSLYFHVGKLHFGDDHPEELAALMRHYAAVGDSLNGS